MKIDEYLRSRRALRWALLALAQMACSASESESSFEVGGAGTTSPAAGGEGGIGGGTVSSSTTGAAGLAFDGGAVGGGAMTCVPGGPADDVDGDGFAPEAGDCDDCDANVGPNAIDVVSPSGGDEDCDGEIDEVEPACDDGLAIDDPDPYDAARALDLCRVSGGPDQWGLVSAAWVMADGGPPPAGGVALANYHLGHGLLSAFGANVTTRTGERMLALSSGTARAPNDPSYLSPEGFSKGYAGAHPDGFPKESPSCPGAITGEPHDAAAIELVIRTPSNAHGFSFDFDFFTYEWPGYVCTTYNDFFVAILSPIPMGQADGNISFDSLGNPVSVNNAFLEVCGCTGNPPSACEVGGKTFACSLGNSELVGTGFGFDTSGYDHGSTSWLETQAPVEPGSEIVVRFAVYDSGDGVLDTTTLIDDWQWIAEPGATVGTTPAK